MAEKPRNKFHSMYFKYRVQRTLTKKPETESWPKEYNLKDDQLKLILQSFSVLDENGDGKISKRELARAYKLAGFNPSKKELDQILVDHDENGDGYIDFAEYFKAMRSKMIEVDFEEERLKTAFRVLDTDQDGYISREELRHAITKTGNALNEKEIGEIIKRADMNRDGKIDFREFVAAGLSKSVF